MFVIGVCHHRLVPLESLAEVVRSHQSAFDQEIERAVDRGGPHRFALAFQLALNGLHRKMTFAKKDDLCDEVTLAGDRLVMLAEMTAEPIEMGRCLTPIEASHQRGRWQIE
jgi:hypothetical protein